MRREPQEPAGSWRSGTYRRTVFILYGAARGMGSDPRIHSPPTVILSVLAKNLPLTPGRPLRFAQGRLFGVPDPKIGS